MAASKLVVSPYLIVQWERNETYSVLRREKICDREKRTKPDRDLYQEILMFKWKKSNLAAKVIDSGSQEEMKQELEKMVNPEPEDESLLAHTAGPSSNRKRQGEKKETVKQKKARAQSVQLSSVLDQVNVNEVELENEQEMGGGEILVNQDQGEPVEIPEFENAQLAPTIESFREIEAKLDSVKALKRKWKNKATTLKAEVEKLKAKNGPDMVDMGGNVTVLAAKLSTIRVISSTPSIYARNLLRLLFKPEELLNRSLFGRKVGANPDPFPEIESARRDAVILATLREYGQKNAATGALIPNDPLQTKIHSTLGDYLREIRKPKLQRRVGAEIN